MLSIVQQTQEWITFRKTKIGASEAPAIMEVSPWKTPYQLWLEKLDLIPNTFKSSAMERGLQMENEARVQFCLLTGHDVKPEVRIHPKIDYMIASLDGITSDGKYAVEIKCPGPKDHGIAAEGVIPDKYYPQLQHQLEVCGLDMIYYFSFDTHSNFLIKVERDDKYIKNMLNKEREFWDCVQSFVAPKCKNDAIMRNDDIWAATANRWKAIRTQLEGLESQECEARNALVAMANNYTTAGAGIRVSKVSKKGAIDYSRVPELKGVNLEAYRKENIDSWRIIGD